MISVSVGWGMSVCSCVCPLILTLYSASILSEEQKNLGCLSRSYHLQKGGIQDCIQDGCHCIELLLAQQQIYSHSDFDV